jgi:hypothetical protein
MSLRRRGNSGHAGLQCELTSVEQFRTMIISFRSLLIELVRRARILFAQQSHYMIHDHQVFESWKHEHGHRRVLHGDFRCTA